ncbi:MAG: tRNA (guanosine(46)-N7)-methyltransferase TrmB [Candidatus Sericytochromatia bacterium]|nr:tRNA (guanosine(46)-N7)-methyltransferase TrmB [Candidatus Sericytochromatia bacterium]
MIAIEATNTLDVLINDKKPLDIEIGFGKGQFILQKAQLYKDINFIGFEVKDGLVNYVVKAIENLRLSNIYVEKSFADVSIPAKIPNERIRNIYVNFPDPWWKRKHKKRRILHKEFIQSFYNSLEIGGIIYVRTDVKEYSEFVQKNFLEFDSFQPIEHDILSDNIMSNREVRCISEGLDIYYLAFKKIK